MFKKFTAINGKPIMIKKELVSCIGEDAAGNTFVAQNGEVAGFSVKETVEEALKIIES